jgi:hypothetical protein
MGNLVRVGVDVGQKRDFTAIVVAEVEPRDKADHYIVRLIERLPLGTSYPDVALRVAAVVLNLQQRSRSLADIDGDFLVQTWVDATGVGLPVVDLIREYGVSVTAALFTSGEHLNERSSQIVTIGKGFMVGRLQTLLQAGRLHLPITVEANILVNELKDYEISVTPKATATFNARSGKHDDLVCALGLAVGDGRGRGGGTSSWLPERERFDPPGARTTAEHTFK